MAPFVYTGPLSRGRITINRRPNSLRSFRNQNTNGSHCTVCKSRKPLLLPTIHIKTHTLLTITIKYMYYTLTKAPYHQCKSSFVLNLISVVCLVTWFQLVIHNFKYTIPWDFRYIRYNLIFSCYVTVLERCRFNGDKLFW